MATLPEIDGELSSLAATARGLRQEIAAASGQLSGPGLTATAAAMAVERRNRAAEALAATEARAAMLAAERERVFAGDVQAQQAAAERERAHLVEAARINAALYAERVAEFEAVQAAMLAALRQAAEAAEGLPVALRAARELHRAGGNGRPMPSLEGALSEATKAGWNIAPALYSRLARQ